MRQASKRIPDSAEKTVRDIRRKATDGGLLEPRCFPGREARSRGAEEAGGQARNSVQWRDQNVGGGGEERGNS